MKKKSPTPSLPSSANVADHTLGNGLRVLVYENFASPAVVVSGFLHAGARDEAPAKAGLAGFATDCLSRGTQRYGYAQLFETMESLGANVAVDANMHTTGLFAKGLAEDAPVLLDVLAQLLRAPVFPEDEVEKERAEWINALEERANSTSAMCGIAFNQLLYPAGHPYAVTSTLETARAITLDDVRAYHRDFIAPAGMTLAFSGAIRAADALARVEALFGDWRGARPARAELPPAPRPSGLRRAHVAMPGKTQTTLSWGLPALPRTHPDWVPCALMNSILGQFGMYGRLGESVRKEEGLVYYIGSRFDGGPGPGAWNCSAGTNPETVERVLDISRAEVRRIQNKRVKPAELDDNKRYFTGSLPLALETNEGIAGQIASIARYNLGLDFLLHYADLVNAVSAADIRRVAETWLDADNIGVASAGPQLP